MSEEEYEQLRSERPDLLLLRSAWSGPYKIRVALVFDYDSGWRLFLPLEELTREDIIARQAVFLLTAPKERLSD